MKCQMCKIKEATNHQRTLHICDSCLIELKLSVIHYIGGKEVTPQEFYRRLNENEEEGGD